MNNFKLSEILSYIFNIMLDTYLAITNLLYNNYFTASACLFFAIIWIICLATLVKGENK